MVDAPWRSCKKAQEQEKSHNHNHKHNSSTLSGKLITFYQEINFKEETMQIPGGIWCSPSAVSGLRLDKLSKPASRKWSTTHPRDPPGTRYFPARTARTARTAPAIPLWHDRYTLHLVCTWITWWKCCVMLCHVVSICDSLCVSYWSYCLFMVPLISFIPSMQQLGIVAKARYGWDELQTLKLPDLPMWVGDQQGSMDQPTSQVWPGKKTSWELGHFDPTKWMSVVLTRK